MEHKLQILQIFDAIEKDDHISVRNILKKNISASVKIPSSQLCGLAVLAAEGKAFNVTKEFFTYNEFALDNSLSKYLNIALKIFSDTKSSSKIVFSETKH